MPITVFDVKGIRARGESALRLPLWPAVLTRRCRTRRGLHPTRSAPVSECSLPGRTGSSGRRCSPPMTSLRLSRTGFGRRLRRNSRADIDGWLCQGGRIPGCLQTLYRRNAWPLDRARLDANLREGSLSCLRGATENGGLQRPGGSRDTPPGTAPNRRRRLEDCKGSIS